MPFAQKLSPAQFEQFQTMVLAGANSWELRKQFHIGATRVFTLCRLLGIDPPAKKPNKERDRLGRAHVKRFLTPSGADPAVVSMLDAVRASNRTWTELELEAGYDVRNMAYRRSNPSIASVRAVLNTLKLDLAVVPLDEAR